jgi:hypothetical protein
MNRVDSTVKQQRDYLRSHDAFVDTRLEAEQDARLLLDSKVGRFRLTDAETFLDACNTERLVRHPSIFDMSDRPMRTRFGPAFIRRNRQQMLSNLPAFNQSLRRLWQSSVGQMDPALERFWTAPRPKGASRGLPTMIAYLREPETNVIWLPHLAKGANLLAREHLSLTPCLRHYSEYRSLVNRELRARYQLKPQELDYVLFCLGGIADDEEP